MLGGFLALISAVSFAWSNATVRRGVLSGTVLQAVGISLPIALPVFVVAMLVSGGFTALASFNMRSWGLLAVAGVIHFAWGRYCNYRATKAIGANLVAPIQQCSLIITLALAITDAHRRCLAETATAGRQGCVGISRAIAVVGRSVEYRLAHLVTHRARNQKRRTSMLYFCKA